MNNTLIKYGLWIIILPLLQALIFNHIYLFGFINPLVYVLFVIIFPFNKNKSTLLLISFLIGFSVDLLSNEGGIHAFALVFVAYIRLVLLRLIKGDSTFDDEYSSFSVLFSNVYYLWTFLLVFIHHLLIFSIEKFSFISFGQILIKTFATSIFTFIIVLFIIGIFIKKRNYEW